MRFFSYFNKFLHSHTDSTKLLVICSLSSGGLLAYADSPSDGEKSVAIQTKKETQKKKVLVLGTGWAGTSFLKDLDISSYDVQVVSPRNYFAFTPLLPSVTCGTVEARSIVEPVRNIIKKRNGEIKFWEAECLKIDPTNRKVFCRSNTDESLAGNNDFSLDYDYLVIAMGAQVNTFDTPGVSKHCHFLKEVEDAQRIRRTVIDCFEKAVLPELTEEERKTNLHFVIVGGGPTGVEFAAELHDFVHEDLVKIYPSVKDLVSITMIQSGDHILNTFDERISSFAEQKFQRDGIKVLTGHRVLSVSERTINMKSKSKGEDVSIPHGMGNRRVLATDEWLRVKGYEDVYALGDCATVDQKKIMEDISAIFKAADKDNSGTLTNEEFQDVIEDIIIRYPQVELYLKSKHLFEATDLLKDVDGSGKAEVDIEGFNLALSNVDKQTKSFPATAQVAAQQGAYLSRCFNMREKCTLEPEGPRKFRSGGRHEFRPFQYRHLGQFAPLGGEQAAAELPGDWVSLGRSTQWLWYSIYASKQVSWRTRFLVVGDWGRRFVFGRDSSLSTAYADAGHNEIKKKKVVVLGTGWAGTSFLKNLKDPSYEVQVVSPRNYFAFTPLLPSVTNGTVEARSIVEPIRSIVKKKKFDVQFREAECYKIDTENKKVHCRSSAESNLGGSEEFMVDYDYLVVSMGARANTFNTPGVVEHAHFLKEIEDAQRIRRTVIGNFERASLPSVSEEEKKRILHFVVVGGGPTGVEFAAELHDFVIEDLAKLYPSLKSYVKITLLEAGDHILNMFDKRITVFAEDKFRRDGIDLKVGSMVTKVTETEICTKERASGQNVSIPYGMVVWSTGIGTRPVIMDFMKQIGQTNRRVLATDEWLRVEGCDNIYALGDCATINQRKVMEDISAIFSKADKKNTGRLKVEDFKDVINDICERYPQVQIYLKKKQLKNFVHLLKNSDNDDEIDIEKFKLALSEVDTQMKNLPATAQVAAQQGDYLADCFNRMDVCEKHPEGPLRFRSTGRHRFRPFRYKHLGQFAPLGGEQTAAQLPGDWVSIGHSTQWLWYSVYASKLVSWRTRALVISDWGRRFIFGRDSSRI
ncbi:hypothetical protein ACJIZ3_007436 [Penstemon smallii]|uniref:External alternative NAD(P)H-ubiquinone oxidoreductase B1, mitochondrial n=1 Tax=Penstemon smallii TaxID=265156 RepID=A0ABD3SAS8_9LAMI